MSPGRPYRLPPAEQARLARGWLGSCLVWGCSLPVAVALLILLRSPLVPQARWMLDLVAVMALLLLLRGLIARQSGLRLALGRRYAEDGRSDLVIAALEPFSRPGGRSLDRSGEAHYLLIRAAEELGEKGLARNCREFLTRHRKGEWSDRAGGGGT